MINDRLWTCADCGGDGCHYRTGVLLNGDPITILTDGARLSEDGLATVRCATCRGTGKVNRPNERDGLEGVFASTLLELLPAP